MAEINNPQLTDFCNAQLRGLATQFTTLLTLVPLAEATYVARNLGTVIDTAGAGNLITDGSETDGRTRRSGGDVYNFMTFLGAFMAFVDDPDFPGRRDVIYGWNVNGMDLSQSQP